MIELNHQPIKAGCTSLRQAIYGLTALPENASIADLGCRDAGFLLGVLQAFPGRIKQAVGVDVNDKSFGGVPCQSPVALRVMDCEKKLDFPDESFDFVFSKDLFECIADKPAFVKEIHRILKPGGSVLCVNCDWDSIAYNGADKALLTKAVHAYATTKQGWMRDLDGWIGRRMFGFFNGSGLFASSLSVHTVVETAYTPETLGYSFSRNIGWLAQENTGALSHEEYAAFIGCLEKADLAGFYCFAKPYYIYRGVKPPRPA